MPEPETQIAGEVTVLVTDVQVIHDALNSAYYKSVCEDTVEAYRTLDDRGRTSALTKQLEDGLRKATAVLELATKEEENDDAS